MTLVRSNISIRHLKEEDAEITRQIYNHAVVTSTATLDIEPRTEALQRSWVESHLGIYTAIVAEYRGEVVGFASISPYRPRAGYSSSVEDSVYVHQDFKGLGIGSLLLSSIMDAAANLGFHSAIAHIVADHEASLRLHTSCGFRLVGVEKEIGRKFGKWVDLAILQRMLDSRGPL